MPKKNPTGLVEWYDKLSDSYEELYAREQYPKYQLALDLVSGRRFDLVLDGACGTGMFLDRVRAGCDLAVGVDLSRRMLEKARARLGIGNVGLIQADCSALPLREKVADRVFAISLVDANNEPGTELSELARAAKADGRLIVTVFHVEGERVNTRRLGWERVDYQAPLSSREDLFVVSREAILYPEASSRVLFRDPS